MDKKSFEKFKKAFQLAQLEADLYDKTEDGGTCNFDTPCIRERFTGTEQGDGFDEVLEDGRSGSILD